MTASSSVRSASPASTPKHLLAEHRVEKLPIVDENDHLTGLITVKDFVKTEQYPNATKDSRGRLIVGAAVGYWGDTWERATALAEAGVDVLASTLRTVVPSWPST